MDYVESSYQYQEEEGELIAAEHEERVHIICELEQSAYLGEDGGEVDERFAEDLKDCFVEIDQHEELKVKASSKVDEPCVFEVN